MLACNGKLGRSVSYGGSGAGRAASQVRLGPNSALYRQPLPLRPAGPVVYHLHGTLQRYTKLTLLVVFLGIDRRCCLRQQRSSICRVATVVAEVSVLLKGC